MFENISSYLRDANLIYTNINLVSPIMSYDLYFFLTNIKTDTDSFYAFELVDLESFVIRFKKGMHYLLV